MSKSPNYCACNHCKITYDTPQICPANLDQCCFQNLSCNNPYGMKTIFSNTVPTFFSYLPIFKKKEKKESIYRALSQDRPLNIFNSCFFSTLN